MYALAKAAEIDRILYRHIAGKSCPLCVRQSAPTQVPWRSRLSSAPSRSVVVQQVWAFPGIGIDIVERVRRLKVSCGAVIDVERPTARIDDLALAEPRLEMRRWMFVVRLREYARRKEN